MKNIPNDLNPVHIEFHFYLSPNPLTILCVYVYTVNVISSKAQKGQLILACRFYGGSRLFWQLLPLHKIATRVN